jgi:ribosomal-protein-alanine N-acetyltransferase
MTKDTEDHKVAARMTLPVVFLRELVPDDLPAVLQIAADCPELQWPRDEILECLRSPDTIGLVAEVNGRVIGFLVYRLDRSLHEVFVKTIAVAPAWRRHGVGRALLRAVDRHLSQGYDGVRMVVPETSLLLQLLLRDGAYRAVRLLRNWYGEEHAYLMEKRA